MQNTGSEISTESWKANLILLINDFFEGKILESFAQIVEGKIDRDLISDGRRLLSEYSEVYGFSV